MPESMSRKCPGLISIRPDKSCLTESGRMLSTLARAARQSPPGFMVRPTSSRRSAAVFGFFGPLWFGSAGIDHLQFRGLADGAFGLRLGLRFQVNLISGASCTLTSAAVGRGITRCKEEQDRQDIWHRRYRQDRCMGDGVGAGPGRPGDELHRGELTCGRYCNTLHLGGGAVGSL